jgi:UDPglucose 6-dehydrogenase
LVTAAGLAKLGVTVEAIDIDVERVARLQAGECPIHEPGLPELLADAVAQDRLRFSTSLGAALPRVDAVMIAVATPSAADGSADLSSVYAVADEIAAHATKSLVVIIKSTVPVGTCAALELRIRTTLLRRRVAGEVAVVSNPEFLREARAVEDVTQPDRIVVGTSHPAARAFMREVYAPLTELGVPLFEMDTRSSELTKYAANAMLATRISFMNQLARVAESVGADIEQIRDGIGSDHRIGPAFLHAGIGFGGSCFPKDLQALRHMASEAGLDLPLIDAVVDINRDQRHLLVRRLSAMMDLKGARIAVWGLAFKPGTDDLRDSPALTVIRDLLDAGAHVVAHDPEAGADLPADLRGKVMLADSPLEAARGAGAILHVTEWPCYRELTGAAIAATLWGHTVLDGRNALDVADLERNGLTLVQVGRSHVNELTAVGAQP